MYTSLASRTTIRIMGLTQSQLRRSRYKHYLRSAGVEDPSPRPTQIEPVPEHWKLFAATWLPAHIAFLRPILLFGLKALCLTSLGHSDLEVVWNVCIVDELWYESTDRFFEWLNTIVVVVSLDDVDKPPLQTILIVGFGNFSYSRQVYSSARPQHS